MNRVKKRSNQLKWSVYSDYEGAFLTKFHEYRLGGLGGFLKLLTSLGITANHVSVLSGIAALLFIPAFVRSTALAILALMAHLALDVIDGPLAKFQGTAGNAGMFVDFCADLIGVIAITVGLTLGGVLEPVVAILHAFLYTAVVFMSLMHSILQIKQPFTFRSRMFIYGFIIGMYVVERLLGKHIDLIQEVTVISSVLMTFVFYKDCLRLYAAAKVQ
ncbi:hypothetical protein HY641_04490 [Candidatus Woesearchaeota archaeon]|nr:hypothetical protein [Candidatus Woesearchaeota archaeon]